MNIIYEIGEQKIPEKELDKMCEEVIEVLKNKKNHICICNCDFKQNTRNTKGKNRRNRITTF